MSHHNYIRLPLRQTFNTRDLGGYASANGAATRWRAFLRSDDPAHCEQDDIDFLLTYGLKTVIDLRSKLECDLAPSPFAEVSDVHYANIPLGFDSYNQAESLDELNEAIPTLAEFYLMILKEKPYQVREIFELMVDRLPDTTLFHCVVGKDRTGVVAMLLLSLAEVSTGDILTNYEVTFSHVMQNPRFLETMGDTSAELLQSRPEFLLPAYEYVHQHFGGAAGYLHSTGMDLDRIEKLKSFLLS
jgi:protein-tyrosine phosphatase